MEHPTIRNTRKTAFAAVAISILVLLGVRYSAQVISAGIVDGVVDVEIAALDVRAFDALFYPSDSTPTIADLQRQHRVVSVPRGTECRIIERDVNTVCRSESHHRVRVKLTTGTNSGHDVWMCSDAIRPKIALP